MRTCVLKFNPNSKHTAFLFFFISIIFINVTIVANLIYSDTLSNLIGSTMRRNRYMIYMLVAIVMVLIYYYVIRGIFSFNIYMMEEEFQTVI